MSRIGFIALFLPLLFGAGIAQEAELIYPKKTLSPPRSEAAEAFIENSNRENIQTEVIFAESITTEKTEREVKAVEQNEWEIEFRDFSGNGLGIYTLIALLIIGILLWMRFGGTGSLFTPNPDQTKRSKPIAPAAWKTKDSLLSLDRQKLFERLKNMKDRREGMIELLRYCLLYSAEQSNIVFARSDTERDAFARIPNSWQKRGQLGDLLSKTELAHYGGRPVNPDQYQSALQIGRSILGIQSDEFANETR